MQMGMPAGPGGGLQGPPGGLQGLLGQPLPPGQQNLSQSNFFQVFFALISGQ